MKILTVVIMFVLAAMWRKIDMESIETIEYEGGYSVEIYLDGSAENPITEWDGNVEFCCWHRWYDLGNSKRYGNGMESPEDCQEYTKETNSLLYSLYIYEHTGIALSLTREYPFNDYWDSGQVGYVLIDREWLKEHFNKKYFTKKMKAKIWEVAKSNVELYNDYLSGSVYGYIIKDSDGNDVDSCWGFYGYDHKKSGLLESAESFIDWEIADKREKHFARLKQWIINKVSLIYRESCPV